MSAKGMNNTAKRFLIIFLLDAGVMPLCSWTQDLINPRVSLLRLASERWNADNSFSIKVKASN